MFLEQYKHAFLSDDIYEKNSIGNNPLFGLNDFFTNNYLNSQYSFPVSLINEFQENIEEVLNKYKFINSFLDSYIKQLNLESIRLDKEFNEINNNISIKGQSFLDMFQLKDKYNYIFEENIIYSRNILDNDDSYIKSDKTLTEIPYYLDYINENSFFIIFEEEYLIKDIYLEFYNNVEYSIFGSKEDNTLELIYDKATENDKLFQINSENKYKKIFVLSKNEIVKYIKKIKIYNYKENNDIKYGYIIRKLSNLNKFSDFSIVNDSGTNFYLYNDKVYNQLVQDIGSSYEKSKLINNNYLIEKNINIKNTFDNNELYLLEFFDYKDNISLKTKIYGKEKES